MAENVSLTELQLIIRDSLYMALPDFYWVIAEISELNENNSGHCYLELIEKNPEEKNVKARVRAIIWSNRYRFLKAFFENSTQETLREGLKILIKVKIEYHELYGLSLIISDIDPAFTIGDMAMKRQLIIKQLEKEGVFTMNKDLPFPVVPQRIAVISSKKAAGYTDFVDQLKNNSLGYVFYTHLLETSLQGIETEHGVISALDKIAINASLFDVVVIIRGGGSQSDLSWFDNYNLAFHVTQFPLPVITGIGHEKDVSVTDLVANKSLKTPTAVADFLIDTISEAENYINEMSSEIVEVSRVIIEKNRNMIETASIKLLPMTRLMLSDVKEKLSACILEINNTGKALIYKASLIPANHRSILGSTIKSVLSGKLMSLEINKSNLNSSAIKLLNSSSMRVNGLESLLQILKPENVLQRGYTITSFNGEIIKNAELLKPDDIIDTQFIDGVLKSKVFGKKT